ncbi:MAG: QacE family quaternary ammonium compound efflux SMR transporter [Actinobacteria bacterium ATB1]|nr:QacE family quaternary ammonium compound efflux SMR transporter [Actinobacteria bacterium ATB1]
MTWLHLALAIASEITATTFLKLSEGFSKLGPSLVTAAGYLLAFFFLAQALRELNVGVAYAVWAGTGTALVAVVGRIFLDEEMAWPGWVGICLIVAGVVLVESYSHA